MDPVARVAALDQPLRRQLFRLLGASDGWTSRDEAAAALDIPRSVAAFHLDKLADAGVVEVRFERTGGRSGPGAGRPSKLYRPAGDELSASLPPREYDLAGAVLADAVAESACTGAPVADCLRAAARTAGNRLAAEARADDAADAVEGPRQQLVDVLSRHGYEPDLADTDDIALANCPFHRIAEQHRELVCGMNLHLIAGVLDDIDPQHELEARLDRRDGNCCVRVATVR